MSIIVPTHNDIAYLVEALKLFTPWQMQGMTPEEVGQMMVNEIRLAYKARYDNAAPINDYKRHPSPCPWLEFDPSQVYQSCRFFDYQCIGRDGYCQTPLHDYLENLADAVVTSIISDADPVWGTPEPDRKGEIMSYMKPEVTFDTVWVIETSAGVTVVPADHPGTVFTYEKVNPNSGDVVDVEYVCRKDIVYDSKHEAFASMSARLREFCDSDVLSAELQSGFIGRLSSPGCSDCTDWSKPFATRHEALENLVDLYGENSCRVKYHLTLEIDIGDDETGDVAFDHVIRSELRRIADELDLDDASFDTGMPDRTITVNNNIIGRWSFSKSIPE